MAAKNSHSAKVTLPSDLEIVITRSFDAPRRLVFEACTKAEHLRHWWGPRFLALTDCDVDFRIGGSYRFVLRAPNGHEAGFHGVYREIAPPERVVSTYVYEGVPDHEAIVTMTFTEQAGVTTLTETILHQSREARDGHLQSGMEEGMQQTFDKLEELLESLIAA